MPDADPPLNDIIAARTDEGDVFLLPGGQGGCKERSFWIRVASGCRNVSCEQRRRIAPLTSPSHIRSLARKAIRSSETLALIFFLYPIPAYTPPLPPFELE